VFDLSRHTEQLGVSSGDSLVGLHLKIVELLEPSSNGHWPFILVFSLQGIPLYPCRSWMVCRQCYIVLSSADVDKVTSHAIGLLEAFPSLDIALYSPPNSFSDQEILKPRKPLFVILPSQDIDWSPDITRPKRQALGLGILVGHTVGNSSVVVGAVGVFVTGGWGLELCHTVNNSMELKLLSKQDIVVRGSKFEH
jgi:hypothetical protein